MKNNDRGFTLLEVIVAMIILAVTLLVVLDAMSGSLSRACEAKFSTTAALLAQKKAAELETIPAKELTSDSGDFGEDYPGYSWELTLETPSFNEPVDIAKYLRQIDLTITWGENSQFKYTLRLYRFLSEP
jgi:general secretion pathway protein I